MQFAFTILLSFFATALLFPVNAADRPNVVITFIDDMGHGDVGFNEATVPKTPNLDRMAAEGMGFNHFYVGCAVCSGSRTSLMIGCHYQRLSMKAVLFPHSNEGLHPAESLCIGHDDENPVDEESPSVAFQGKLLRLKLE